MLYMHMYVWVPTDTLLWYVHTAHTHIPSSTSRAGQITSRMLSATVSPPTPPPTTNFDGLVELERERGRERERGPPGLVNGYVAPGLP